MEQRKVAFITGGAKGLGRMTALTLARQGCDLIVNYLSSRKEAEELAASIEALGTKCLTVQGDITQRTDLEQMVETANARMGGIDILVNNAGPFIRERRLFGTYTLDEMDALIRGNLLSTMMLDSLVLPYMRERQWGRIIHYGFGHAAEARGWPHRAVYAAAKVGLVSFTKTLAEEEASSGITVNMICPGDIRGGNKEKRLEEVLTEQDEETPRGRPGTGEDVARVISFLCEPQSDFITGAILDITGGLDPIQTLPSLSRKQ